MLERINYRLRGLKKNKTGQTTPTNMRHKKTSAKLKKKQSGGGTMQLGGFLSFGLKQKNRLWSRLKGARRERGGGHDLLHTGLGKEIRVTCKDRD